nr:hypothetical protein BaRGS_029243 [Batillaria attramentaria]
MVKRQARVEDILKERDAARRIGAGPSDPARARMHMRGPPPDYQTALRNKRDDQNPRQVEEVERNRGNHDVPRQPSIRDELERTAKKDTASSDHRPDGVAEDSEEARLLQMIDAQVQQEITDKQRQSSSPEDSDPPLDRRSLALSQLSPEDLLMILLYRSS